MKKIFFASVAIGLLSLSVARADTANVNVYGTINTTIEEVKAGGAAGGEDYAGRLRFQSNSTNVGVKGSEDLGEGFKGIFQIELDVRIPEGTLGAPSITGTTNPVGLRNSMLGLQGGFGTVFFGKWDTPNKTAVYFAEPFYATGVGYFADLLDVLTGFTPNFNTRQSNSIQYWTPKFAGLSAQLVYSPRGLTSVTATDSLYGGSLTYGEGPINAAFSYERHVDFVASGTRDTVIKAGAGYKLFDTTGLNFVWRQLKYVTAADVDSKNNAILFSATHKLGDTTFRGGYAIAGKVSVSGTDKDLTGAKQLSLGASYSLSKRTDVYGLFSKIYNDDAAKYNFLINAVGSSLAGADPQAIALGIRHSF